MLKVKKILFILLSMTIVFILSSKEEVFAFSGRDGNEIITCTKLTEPYEILSVASQGGTNYGKYYVQAITGGDKYYIYDIEQNEFIATIPFQGDGSAYKNNNANFGSEFYDESDELPLLYISSAYDYEINVFRVYKENNVWKIMCVQKISYPTLNNNNGYFSCNSVIDSQNGYLYLTPLSYIYTTLENEQKIIKFELPSLSEGNVELTINDAIDQIAVWDYIHAPQGALLLGDKIYQLHGVGNAYLRVFDLSERRYIKTYKLSDFGYNMEPESLGYYNGIFYSMDDSLEMWKIEIEEDPYTPVEGTYKEETLSNWVRGSINPTNGNESSSEKIARSVYPIKTLDADKLIIESPKHYLGENPGSYYKWRVIWFNGTNCLGLAEEQCDFTTFTEFNIPQNANCFRLAIAAVYKGKTQNTFPLSPFLSNGGMKIKLFYETLEDNECSININNWEQGSFNNDGTLSNKAQIARMNNIYKTYGATQIKIDVPVHYTGATSSRNYYKWSLLWYNGNNCLGLATEQNNFDTVSVYDVPSNANGYRIKIASVKNGETESNFPLSNFINKNGINVILSNVNFDTLVLNEWEPGSISTITGVENNKTRIARTQEIESTNGAGMLIVIPKTHYTGQTTNSNYYKWRIVWFDDNDCLGIAQEQEDFSRNISFVVPIDANGYRLTIASVVNSVTEDPFPLTTFINNGGITVTYLGSN